jgi:hypothetical protein
MYIFIYFSCYILLLYLEIFHEFIQLHFPIEKYYDNIITKFRTNDQDQSKCETIDDYKRIPKKKPSKANRCISNRNICGDYTESKGHYHIRKMPPCLSNLSQINLIHATPGYIMVYFIFSLAITLTSSK